VSGVITEKELIKVGHDQAKIYKKMLNYHNMVVQQLEQVFDTSEQIRNHEISKDLNIEKQKESLSNSKTIFDLLDKRGFNHIRSSDVDFIIEEVTSIDKSRIRVVKDRDKILVERFKLLSDWIGKFETAEAMKAKDEFEEFFKYRTNRDMFYEKGLKVFLKIVKDITSLNLTLYFLSVLTIQHSTKTRYITENVSPLKFYLPKLAMINRQDELMDLMERALMRFKWFFPRERDQ